MGQATDRDLWRRAVDGDPDAFGLLFERHAQGVYTYLFRRTADWALAEDLTSVVFLEAWRRRTDVRLERELLLPWLLGVSTNVLRNRRRSQWRHRAALGRLPREHVHDFADEANDRLDDKRQMRTVLRAIAKLPRREQDVLALCAWAELSYEEAAVALGVPIGTVRSRLSRARTRIRELSSAHGDEPDCEPAVPAAKEA